MQGNTDVEEAVRDNRRRTSIDSTPHYLNEWEMRVYTQETVSTARFQMKIKFNDNPSAFEYKSQQPQILFQFHF